MFCECAHNAVERDYFERTVNEQRTNRTIRRDQSLAAPLARWHADHSNFVRLINFIQQQLDAFEAGQLQDYELMRLTVSYLRHFPDRFHHPREDVAYNRLIQRAPHLRLDIEWCIHEHALMAETGEELLTCLNQIIAGDEIKRMELKAAAATYIAYYRHHLAVEEHQVIPHAVDVLRPDDWVAVSDIAAEPDPLFGSEVETGYRRLRSHIDA